MKKDNNKMLLKNKNTILIVALIGYGIAFIIFLIEIITSESLLKPDLTYIGFNNFIQIFSFPFQISIATTTLLGLLIAYNKFRQDSENFSKQFQLHSNNINPTSPQLPKNSPKKAKK